MYDRLLVATDGSKEADDAVEYGVGVAEVFDASAEFVYVVDTDVEDILGEEAENLLKTYEDVGDTVLDDAVRRASGVRSSRTLLRGSPSQEILGHADETGVDAMVLGGSGRGSSPLGGTAERVVTLSSTDVYVTPRDRVEAPSLESVDDVVMALDGSDVSERAGERGLKFAERFGATVHALYVLDNAVYELADAPGGITGALREAGEATVEEFTRRAESVEVSSTGRVSEGTPSEEILLRADEVDADLVSLGTRGLGRASERVLGSTTRRVLRDSTHPVLAVN